MSIINEDDMVEEQTWENPSSIATPLLWRTVCDTCEHFHRIILIKKCECCAADYRAMKEELNTKADERATEDGDDGDG